MAERRTGYQIDLCPPKDSETGRNKFARLASALVSSAALLAIPTLFTAYWGWLLGEHQIIGGIIGFSIAGWFASDFISKRIVIYIPEWTGYVTQDGLFGTMVPYGPGYHLSHWWEQRNQTGNYSLKVITHSFEVDVPTQTAKITVRGKYEFAISLPYIVKAIGVDQTTIEAGLTAFIESFLTETCSKGDAEKVRGQIAELNEQLADRFMTKLGTRAVRPNSFESDYGFKTVGIVIQSITLPAEAQKTRDAKDEAAALRSVVEALYGFTPEELNARVNDGRIDINTYNQMLNRAMATSGNATLDISVVEGDAKALGGKMVQKLVGGKRK